MKTTRKTFYQEHYNAEYFNKPEILALTKLKLHQINYLLIKKIITPLKVGKHIYFTWSELLEIKTIIELREHVSLQKIRNCKDYLAVLGLTKDFANKTMIASNKQIYMIADGEIAKQITILTGKKQGESILFIYSMNQIIEDIYNVQKTANIYNFESKKQGCLKAA